MRTMKTRKIKVCATSGYKYKDTPTITLKGNWLKEAGFDIDNLITVEMVDGKLIISHREEEIEKRTCVRVSCAVEACSMYRKRRK